MSLRVRRAQVLEVVIDALVYLLAGVVAVRLLVDGAPHAALGAALAGATAGLYLIGTVPTRRRGRPAALWFGLTVGAWAALVIVDAAGVYIGFALCFVALDRFAPRVAVALVALMTGYIVVAEVVWHELGAPAVIGPVIGAAVVVALGLGYRSLEHENEQRRALIAELHRAQADLAAAERQRGILEERERLAREIHDTVAQGLASIVILLGATDQELQGNHIVAARAHIDQARDTARTNLEEARRFVRAIAPSALAAGSLVQALAALCEDTGVPGAVPVRFETSGVPRPIRPASDAALLRVAQSALSNMASHSRARHGRVTLSYMSDVVSLDIHDDGVGFDPGGLVAPGPGHSTGFGLVAMRQRIEQQGGTFAVESAPGKGTVIAASLPVPVAAPVVVAPDPGAGGERPVVHAVTP